MNKLLMTVATLMVATPYIFATQPLEKIQLKDGSVYMGHTIQQIFDGKNSKTIFFTDSVYKTVPKGQVSSMRYERQNLENLTSENWKNWFNAHPQLTAIDEKGNREVVLYRINLEGERNSVQAFLLEKSPDTYKFYIIEATRDTIPDDEIALISYAQRDPLDVNGIVDEITTVDDDKYTGQIVSWNNDFTGLLTAEGTVEYIPNDKIARKAIAPLNPNLPLVEQVEFLDIVEGDYNIEGIIILRNRRPSIDKEPYYTILNSSEREEDMKMEDVKSIKRSKNGRYKPLRDIILGREDDILVNGLQTDSVLNEAYKNDKANYNGFKLSENANPIVVPSTDDSSLDLIVADNSLNNDLYLIPITKKTILPNDQSSNYYFTYEDLVKENIRPRSVETTKFGNKKISYNLRAGLYLIYRKNDNSSYLIQVN
ncbi:MAG: hypothetical protein J1F43_01825 [Muribaculaceae bacterium]|nr:hypothetical protein [Muribaculaceae bacterium]